MPHVALLIEIGVVRTLIFSVSLRWNDDYGLHLGDLVEEMIGAIAFVGHCVLCLETVDKFMRIGEVVALPRTCDQANRKPECIACGVDFSAQAAARPSQALGIRPPFDRRAPAAC